MDLTGRAARVPVACAVQRASRGRGLLGAGGGGVTVVGWLRLGDVSSPTPGTAESLIEAGRGRRPREPAHAPTNVLHQCRRDSSNYYVLYSVCEAGFSAL